MRAGRVLFASLAVALLCFSGVAWADVDCVDVGRQVEVGSYDPNGLDADGDGIGCETYGTGGSYAPDVYGSDVTSKDTEAEDKTSWFTIALGGLGLAFFFWAARMGEGQP